MIRHRYIEFIILVWAKDPPNTRIIHRPYKGTFGSSIALVVCGEATRLFRHTGALQLNRILWSTLLIIIVDRTSGRRYSRLHI